MLASSIPSPITLCCNGGAFTASPKLIVNSHWAPCQLTWSSLRLHAALLQCLPLPRVTILLSLVPTESPACGKLLPRLGSWLLSHQQSELQLSCLQGLLVSRCLVPQHTTDGKTTSQVHPQSKATGATNLPLGSTWPLSLGTALDGNQRLFGLLLFTTHRGLHAFVSENPMWSHCLFPT